MKKNNVPMIQKIKKNILAHFDIGKIEDAPFTNAFIGDMMNNIYLRTLEQYNASASKKSLNDYLNKLFSPALAIQLANRFTFKLTVSMAKDLNMSLEELIYGTEDSKEIAKYNYEHYEQLSASERKYLSDTSRFSEVLKKKLEKLLEKQTNISLATELGINTETLRHYVKDYGGQMSGIPTKVSVIEKLAAKLNEEPSEVLIMPKGELLKHEYDKYYTVPDKSQDPKEYYIRKKARSLNLKKEKVIIQ